MILISEKNFTLLLREALNICLRASTTNNNNFHHKHRIQKRREVMVLATAENLHVCLLERRQQIFAQTLHIFYICIFKVYFTSNEQFFTNFLLRDKVTLS